MKSRISAGIAASLVALCAAGQAQQSDMRSGTLIAATRIAGPAHERLANSENPALLAGDTLEYEFKFTNTRSTNVRNVAFVRALPTGMRYVPGSVTSSRRDVGIEFSTDGGMTFSTLPVVDVLVGEEWVQRTASTSRYTHVRWVVYGQIAPGSSLGATLRSIVQGDVSRPRLARTVAAGGER